MGKQKWSVLGPLKRTVKKIKFLLHFRKWRLASSILWNASSSSSSSSGTIRRLSFNDRSGLRGVIEDVESDHQGKPDRALERARSHGSSSDDDVDKRAEIFITNFRRQLLMERQECSLMILPSEAELKCRRAAPVETESQISNSRSSPLRAAASSSTVVDTTTNAPVSSTNSNVAFNVIEEELRQSLEAVFSKIWSQTIAAAIYRATLRAAGEDAAIKRIKQILIDAVVHAVNEDCSEMANDFTGLGFLASGTDILGRIHLGTNFLVLISELLQVNYGVDCDDGDYDDYDDDYDAEDDVEAAEPKHETAKYNDKVRLWRCAICNYDNDESMTACDICEVIRNPVPGSIKRAGGGATNKGGIILVVALLWFDMTMQTACIFVVVIEMAVVGQQWNDDFVTEEGNNFHKCGSFQGNSDDISSCIDVAPFKFNIPSPDDLVSDGLHPSQIGSKAELFNSRYSNVTAGVTEIVKSSDKSSALMPKGKQGQQISDGSSASISKGRPGVDEGNQKKNGIVGTQSSDETSDSTSSTPKGKDKRVDYSSSSTNRGESLGLTGNLNEMSLSDKSGKSYKASAKRHKSSAQYQPDKWMLPGKSENALTQLNLAIVGHVDSGKSTLSVAVAYFDSKNYHVVVIDSPGHKDFVPNMISGSTQADAAILVIDASVGGFEAGMDNKGQTREHAILIRSFGVDQIIVAVNKMDSVEYSKDRFDLIRTQLGTFLRSCGFKDSLVSWIPLSAVENQNLVAAPSDIRLSSWYRGPYLLDAIDSLQPPTRDFTKPLLMPICDVVISSSQGQVSACGKLEAGALRSGLKVLVMPSGDVGTVRSLERDSKPCDVARAGDNVTVSLLGIDGSNVMTGGVLCHPDFPVAVARHFELKVLVLDLEIPLVIGSQLEFHGHHAKEAARVVKIISVLDPKTGKVTKKAPRRLISKQSAVIEVFLDGPVCMEEFTNCRALGRVFLRTSGKTIALGIITRIIEDQE
ncbi:elongation factor 1-alpha-like isoform X1 [Populus alba x Populus x berolinensis]|nr:elongation factor 1-alpha-like isoform X1 [Populus alba x Populus x berolinensis]